MSNIGHNSSAGGVAAKELRLFVERVERLTEEKAALGDDIKEVMSEMKSFGYDTRIVRKILAIRKQKAGQFEEEQATIETYLHALGMI